MKSIRKISPFLFLCIISAISLYVTSVYGFSENFFLSAKTAVVLMIFSSALTAAVTVKKKPLPFLLCLTAGIAGSLLYYPFCFLFFPPLMTLCLFQNINSTDKSGRIIRRMAFALHGLTFVSFIIALIKTDAYSDILIGERDSIFGHTIRILVFVTAAFGVFLFYKSFSVVSTKTRSPRKKKNTANFAYPESLHTVYLLAALSSLATAVYCCYVYANDVVCVCLIAWTGCYAALFISGEPVTAYLQTKAASFFGFSAGTGQKGAIK